jgi:hypothetical protein
MYVENEHLTSVCCVRFLFFFALPESPTYIYVYIYIYIYIYIYTCMWTYLLCSFLVFLCTSRLDRIYVHAYAYTHMNKTHAGILTLTPRTENEH